MKTLILLLTAAAACCYSASACAADQAAAPDPAQVDSSTAAAPAPPPAEAPPSDTGKTKWVFTSIPYLWASGSKSVFTTRQGETLTTEGFLFRSSGGFEVCADGRFRSEARPSRSVGRPHVRQTRQLRARPSRTDTAECRCRSQDFAGHRTCRLSRRGSRTDVFRSVCWRAAHRPQSEPRNYGPVEHARSRLQKDLTLRRSLERVSEPLLGGGGEPPSTAMWAASASAPTCRGRRLERSNTTSASIGSSEADGVIITAAPATRVSS